MSVGSRTRSASTALLQMIVTAAIVATLVYLPVCVVLALTLRAFGISFEAWLTLGKALHPALGLVVWWLFIFLGSCGYAAWLFPWGDKVFGWPGRD
ncbi:MAG TPA: hypothetical protein VFV84_01560 [Burkholderiales bacterium]|nr:hypothetical protein [Burkholderiales bacterium]